MKLVRLVALALAGLVVASPALPAPLEAYGKLPFIEDLSLSPDGKRLALILTDGEQRSVLIKSLDDGANLLRVPEGNKKVRSVSWADNNILLVTSSSTGGIVGVIGGNGENFVTNFIDVAARSQKSLMGAVKESALNTTIGVPTVRIVGGETQVFVEGVEFVDSSSRLSLFRVSVPSGRVKLVQSGANDTTGYLVDDQGEVAAETRYQRSSGDWMIRAKRSSGWATLAQGKDAFGGAGVVGFGHTPGTLLISRDDEQGRGVQEITIETGALGPVQTRETFGAPVMDRKEHVVGSTILVRDQRRYSFFDPVEQANWNGIAKAYPDEQVSFADASDDHKRVVVLVDSRTNGPGYQLVDLASKKASLIADIRNGLTAKDIAPRKAVSYAAADGKMINGYLTLPQGKDKGLALVVLPHGGPASRDGPGFDWWAQALASRGYAVLQPNFRGSTGYGPEFLAAGYGEWGKKMQTDLSDGVRFLAGQGTIDPKRVCIVGASYGGYAALAGAAIDRGVYRCAAAVAGPADLPRMLQLVGRSSDSTLRYWNRFMGATGANDPALVAISPAKLADKVDIPVLLVHGKDDTVVAYEQSRIMADALKKAGKPVDFVTLDGEDHWLSRGDTRLKMLQAVTTFLEKNNPPG